MLKYSKNNYSYSFLFRRATSALLALLIVFAYSAAGVLSAQALPTGWNVVEGDVTVDITGDIMTITSTTDTAIISYISFDLANGETINFIMPGASSSIINQVIGGNISNIAGSINANGIIGLQNTAGIQIANTAQINAAALLATTLNIGNFDGTSIGLMKDAGQDGAAIVNDGDINVSKYAILAGSGIANMGSIIAEDGTIHLAVGDAMTFHLSDNQSISVTIDSGIQDTIDGLNATITNSGTMEAHQVELKAKLADQVIAQAINNDGVIEATQLSNQGGSIVIEAVGGTHTVMNSGTLMATGDTNQTGGTIHVLGQDITHQGATLDVSGGTGGGEILVGGDYQGKGSVQNAMFNTVDKTTYVNANATHNGDGGRVIFWADDTTMFTGKVDARGGDISGDGGFVEVSGKIDLGYNGLVDTRALNGQTGTLLLDPTNITIRNGNGANDAVAGIYYEQQLESQSTTTNISLSATNDITLQNLGDNTLDLTNAFTLTSGRDINFADNNDTIRTEGSNITFNSSDDIAIGRLDTTGAAGTQTGGIVTLRATNDITSRGIQARAAVTIMADESLSGGSNFNLEAGTDINTNGGALTIAGENITINDDINSGGGAITINVDRNNTNDGDFSLGDNDTITSGGGNIDITGGDRYFLTQNGSGIAAGAGDVTITEDGNNDGNDIDMNNNFFITGRNLTITGADVRMRSNSNATMTGNIAITTTDDIEAGGGDLTATGTITLRANDTITARELNSTGGNNITISADNDSSGGGNFTLNAGNNIDTNGGNLSISGESVTINDDVDTDGGSITISANKDGDTDGDFRLGGNDIITSGGGTISITGADRYFLDQNGSGIAAGAGDVTITDNGNTDGNDIEMNNNFFITGRNLTMNADDIRMRNNVDITMTGNVDIDSRDDIEGSAGDIRAAGTIDLNADDTVVIREATSTGGNTITLVSDNDNNGAGNLTLNAGNNIDTNGGNLILSGESVTINDDVETNGGSITVTLNKDGDNDGDFRLGNNDTIVSGGGHISITGGDRYFLDQGGSGIEAGAGDVTITDNGNTDGNDVDMNNGFYIRGRNLVMNADDIRLRNNTDITMTGTIDVDSRDNIDGGGGDFSAGSTIDLHASDTVSIRDVISTGGGNVTLVSDNDNNGAGDFTLNAGNNIDTNGGNLVISGNSVAINDDVDTNGGTVTITLDRNNSGNGTFRLGNNDVITSSGGNVSITGGDRYYFDQSGSGIAAGTGDVTIIEDGNNDGNDIDMNNNFFITGRNLTMNGADIRMRSTSNINMTGDAYLVSGDDIDALQITTGGNLGLEAGNNITVGGNGLTANGSSGWNGAADESLVVWARAGDVRGSRFTTGGAGNMRIQAGSAASLGGGFSVDVSRLNASQNVALYATGADGGISIRANGTSSIAGNVTATGLTASNNFGATTGRIDISTNSGDIESAMMWSGENIQLTANGGSITQDTAHYGTGYNNSKTLYANNNIVLTAQGAATSHIDTGVQILNTTGNLTALASGNNGGLSIRTIGRVDGNGVFTHTGGGNTSGEIWLGTTLGGSIDSLDDTDQVMDIRGNTTIRSNDDVHIYGAFGLTGSVDVIGRSLTARTDKWDLNFSRAQTSVGSGTGIDIGVYGGNLLGTNLSTSGSANMILEAGNALPQDKLSFINLTSVTTGGNLSVNAFGSNTGDATGNSITITGSTGGSTTATSQVGGIVVTP